MSIYYYSNPIDTSNIDTSSSIDSFEAATNFKFDFATPQDDLTPIFRVDGDMQGNVYQVLSQGLEEELVDEENEDNQAEIEDAIEILQKLGDETGNLLDTSELEPFVGFIGFDELTKLLGFLEHHTFQNSVLESIKKELIPLLREIESTNMGLVVTFA